MPKKKKGIDDNMLSASKENYVYFSVISFIFFFLCLTFPDVALFIIENIDFSFTQPQKIKYKKFIWYIIIKEMKRFLHEIVRHGTDKCI